MLKLINTTGGALTAGQTIPFSVKYNTNNKTSYNTQTNQISINDAGYFDIEGTFVITATAIGDISIQLYANNVAIPEAIDTYTFSAIGQTKTLVIKDIERIIKTYNFEKVKLEIKVSSACSLNVANASVVEIR